MGSLGQQRFVAIASWEGGHIAREAKAILPSACVWLDGHIGSCQSYYEKAIQSAVRSHDPFQKVMGTWLIRRLSPESNPIEIADLPETNILRDLRRRKSNWLRSAARDMAKAMEGDWKK
jgi:hypothetical protein